MGNGIAIWVVFPRSQQAEDTFFKMAEYNNFRYFSALLALFVTTSDIGG
jgi:hypothetical protein